MDEVKRLQNGDYVYAFYPGTKIKRQTVWQV